MSNYRGHTLFNLLLFLPITTIAIFFTLHPIHSDLLIYIFAFIYATLFMTPDADVADKIKLLSLRGVMTLPFRLYSKLFSHRGISHWIVIGTITRVVWLALFFALIYTVAFNHTLSYQPLLSFYYNHKASILYCFSGLCLSDIGHILLDKKP